MTSRNLTTTAALIALAVTGCTQKPFYNEGEPTNVGRLAEAQAAVGAANDGMLYDAHFDGPALNSLGQGKLDLMLKGTPAGQPVRVYFNMPHDQSSSREPAVAAYLKASGMAESQVVLVEGPNSANSTPTAYLLGGAYKGEGVTMTGAPAPITVGGPAGGAGTPAGK